MRLQPALPCLCVLAWVIGRLAAQSPADTRVPAGYKLAPGPFKVASENLVLEDGKRHKNLEITVRYPVVDAGADLQFPLVVFSHGAGGSRAAFTELTTHWASNGYVVVLPTHSDSIELRRRQGEDLTRLSRNLSSLLTDVRPLDRLADIVFLLDSIPELERKLPGLRNASDKGRIDTSRIAMAGHSAGALTTQMVSGVKVRAGGLAAAPRDIGDARIKACILVSGQGTTNRLFTDQSWADLAKPMLVITGSKDVAAIGNETTASRREPFEKARPGDKYLLFIEGATHSSYQGKDRALALDPSQPTDDELGMITGATSAATQAFLDAYLKDDRKGRAWLLSDGISILTAGKATLNHK